MLHLLYLVCVMVLHRAAMILLFLGPPLALLAPYHLRSSLIASPLLWGHLCRLHPELLCLSIDTHSASPLPTPPSLLMGCD